MSTEYLDTADVAESLGVSRWWVREQAKANKLPHIRIGDGDKAAYKFTAADVAAFVESLRPAPALTRKRRRRRAAS